MTARRKENSELVYSSEGGRERREGGRGAAPSGPPRDGIVRVGRSSSGRRGKTVTIVTGLPPAELAATAKELKRLCGSGGAVKDGTVEIQGDHRERIVAALAERHTVKLTGG
jgi:translation initiation factor 1